MSPNYFFLNFNLTFDISYTVECIRIQRDHVEVVKLSLHTESHRPLGDHIDPWGSHRPLVGSHRPLGHNIFMCIV